MDPVLGRISDKLHEMLTAMRGPLPSLAWGLSRSHGLLSTDL